MRDPAVQSIDPSSQTLSWEYCRYDPPTKIDRGSRPLSDAELQAVIAIAREFGDARLKSRAAIDLTGNVLVVPARQVAEHAALPFDAHGVRVVGIVRFAHQRQRIAHPQLRPDRLGFVMAQARSQSRLHQDAGLCLLCVRGQRT